MKADLGLGRRPRRRLIAEMNLIPLIDVALILVIIFMVLTPVLVRRQLTVKLPKAESGEPAPAQTAITVQIAENGAVTVEGEAVRWSDLQAELTRRLSRAASRTLLVQADRRVPVEKVVTVLDIAKRLGVGRLGVGVTPERR